MRLFFIMIMGFVLSACSGEHKMGHGDGSHHGGIMIDHVNVQPPFPGRDVSAAFFTVINHGEADRLIAVKSDISDKTELHNHIDDKGVMKMRRVEGVDIAKGGTLVFKPGSYHVMMFESQIADNKTETELTFIFEKSDPITMRVPIGGDHDNGADEGAAKKMDHSNH